MEHRQFTSRHIPPVCGFNLLEKFIWAPEFPRGRQFREWDFDFMAEHGFSFVRLPMDYRCWLRSATEPVDRRAIDESVLAEIAAAVELGVARGMHVCIAMHRGPGYCINRPEIEPYNLWTDAQAQDDFAHHWRTLAACFASYSSDALSFDLINEPPRYGENGFTRARHRKVVGIACQAIREVTPNRLIICDGHDAGHKPSPELVELNVAQSMRGYIPMTITHYNAPWATWHTWPWPEPRWPAVDEDGGPMWDRQLLDEKVYQPWRDLQARGVGVHCGEFGVYNQTPPEPTYAFLDSLLAVLTSNGWGWAMWNLRGSMGVLDNGRAGVQTEPCDGHQLDRAMLELLKRHLP